MYIRCKRLKTTIFVEVDPKETILEVKGKLQKLLDGKDPEDMKLVQVSNSLELEDAKLISELKIQNDEVVGLCYRKEGAEDGDAAWEEVNITPFPEASTS